MSCNFGVSRPVPAMRLIWWQPWSPSSRQPHAQAFYEAARLSAHRNFDNTPAAAFHGGKRLD
jgi:hypothetical protein